MSLGQDIAAALPELQAAAVSMMFDACSISTSETGTVLDEETLEYTDAPIVSYEGPCRVRFQNAESSELDVAGQLLTAQRATISLPIETSVDVEEGHIVTITAARFDASLVGRRFRVEGFHHQSLATARRLPVKEIS